MDMEIGRRSSDARFLSGADSIQAIKTKAQQRALSGLEPRTPLTQLRRLVRGIDPENPKPWLTGIARLYRGLVTVNYCSHFACPIQYSPRVSLGAKQ